MRFKSFFQEKTISYSAVVIDDQSRSALLSNPQVAELIGPDHEVIAHHMTIKLGSLEGTPHINRLGKKEEFTATDVGTLSGNIVAVKVDGISDNEKPHITISLNRNAGVKPKDSNSITDWTPLQSPVVVRGVVLEI